jgi:hypothetical protein
VFGGEPAQQFISRDWCAHDELVEARCRGVGKREARKFADAARGVGGFLRALHGDFL